MENNEPRGLICPNAYCKALIPITYEALLGNSDITCPRCRLKLTMSVPCDMKEHVQNIEDAERQIEAAKKFRH